MGGNSEPEFRAMVKGYGWGWHKYGDVRYCIHCHQALPKSEMMPDFMVSLRPIYVEVKNSDKTGKWNWRADIGPEGAREMQRQFLIENDGWLFIELGLGRRPKGFSAYLLRMNSWIADVEPFLEQASLPRQDTPKLIGADNIMGDWKLQWLKGRWTIPNKHAWWYYLHSQTQALLESIEEKL